MKTDNYPRAIDALPQLLEACEAAYEALDNVYDVDYPEPGRPVESPFGGAGRVMDQLRRALDRAEGKS